MNTTRRNTLATRASRLTTFVGLALAALSLPAQAQDANPNAATEGQWVPGRLLVQPRPGLSEAEFDKILKPHGARSVGRIEGIGDAEPVGGRTGARRSPVRGSPPERRREAVRHAAAGPEKTAAVHTV